MNRRQTRTVGHVALIALASLTILWGCGKLFSPSGVEEPALELPSQEGVRGILGDNVESTYSEKIIGPKGGKLNCWQHRIKIPRGALREDTLITILWPNIRVPVLDFGPHGIQFSTGEEFFGIPPKFKFRKSPKLPTIRISYQDDIFGPLNEDRLHINWFNPETGQWVNIGGKVDKEEKYVEVTVNHLSRYALADE